jgi:predicted HicB family RNase H-like nuclease
MNTMRYKGYVCRIDLDARDQILVGRLLGIRDIVSFHADSVTELHSAFEEAVDDYIATCDKLGKTPEKPASGKLMLRVAPNVHSAALIAAQASGMSLNKWASGVLAQAAHA